MIGEDDDVAAAAATTTTAAAVAASDRGSSNHLGCLATWACETVLWYLC